MSLIIATKTCYATVGNLALNGSRVTLRIMCAQADARTVFDSFVDGAYYSTVGSSGGDTYTVNGWFQRDQSSSVPHEVYAELVLVFDCQSVQGLIVTTGNANRYEPVYSLGITADERPIEQHPDFLCFWAYNLYELVALGASGTTPLPAWAATDTNPNAIHANYLWSRTPPASQDPAKEYVQVQAATKPGKDSYLIMRPVVTSTIYYRSRNIQNSDLVNGGKLKAPPETYIYPNTQTCWLVQPSGVSEVSDDLMAVTTNYVYAAEGWDTDIYELAPST